MTLAATRQRLNALIKRRLYVAGRMPGSLSAREAVARAARVLEEATYEDDHRPADFLRLVDEQQAVFFQALNTRYPEGYAKLLALKICNLYVGRYHTLHRHTALASSPVQLMVDPSNACQLRCPGCVHSANKDFKERAGFEWPIGNLSEDSYEAFLKPHAPFAFGIVFYNYGEPFLNKKTPAMIRRSKDFLLTSMVSSNLSLPKLRTEEIVASGLNVLYASLDGATQETYERYRRQGKLDQAYSNIRDLVAEKRRQGRSTPSIRWTYLTFEHNVHEMELALAKGRELGVNHVDFTTPFSVEHDDPEMVVVEAPEDGRNNLTPGLSGKDKLDDWTAFRAVDPAIEASFEESWVERGARAGALDQPSHRGSAGTCGWLYQNLTMDATGRIMPCCLPPRTGARNVFGHVAQSAGQPLTNLEDLQASRLAFADRAAYEQAQPSSGGDSPPFCASCEENPAPTYALADVYWDLCHYDRRGVFDHQVFKRLTTW